MATDNIATLGIKVDPKGAISGASKAKRAIGGIGNVANRVKSQIFSLNGALGALGAGAMLRSALKYATSIESLKVQLKFLTGSAKDAGKAFDYMLGFAKSAPFTLKEIQRASPSLLTVTEDVDELNALLSITGDIAASSVLSFQEVAQQLQKTFAGGISAADQFRDSGVKAMLGFETGVKYTAEESKKHIMNLWEENKTSMKGATKDMALTFEGQVSMMGDAWDELQLAFMNEGVFDETKTGVKEISSMLRDPETLKSAKELGQSVTKIGLALKSTVQVVMGLPSEVTSVGLVLFLLGGAKARVAIAMLTAVAVKIDAIRDAIKGITGDDVRLQFNGLDVGELKTAQQAQIKIYNDLQQKIKDVKGEMNQAATNSDDTVFWQKNEELGILNKQAKDTKTTISELITMIRDSGKITTPKTFFPTDFQPPTPPKEKEYSNKWLKNAQELITTTDKYKASIAGVGIELTKKQELEKGYNSEVQRIKAYITEKNMSSATEAKMIGQVTTAYDEAIKRMDEADIAKKVAGIASIMESSITDMIMNIGNGANSLKDTVKNMARAILAEFIKIQVARPAANFLSSFTSGMFRADGGTVTGNQPYVVGEQGAELFVPNKTGTIIPNDAMSSGGGSGGETNVSVSFNITANDTTGFDDLLDSRRGMIVGIINQAMNDRGITGVTA